MLTFEVNVTLDEVTVRWKNTPGSNTTADMLAEEMGVTAATALGYTMPPTSSFGGAGGQNSMTWKKPVKERAKTQSQASS